MNLDFESKFRQVIKKIEETGVAYSEAKGQSWQMQELKSSVLASIIKAQPDMPISKAEITARASEEYHKYVVETSQAITKELRLKAEYEKWKSSFEALRSLCSLEKSTQKEIGE
jgi:hypothetical protein